METCHLIDVRPVTRAPLLARDEYTGRSFTPTVGTKAGKRVIVGKLLTCQRTGGAQFYLVSVDGGLPRWCDAGAVQRAVESVK